MAKKKKDNKYHVEKLSKIEKQANSDTYYITWQAPKKKNPKGYTRKYNVRWYYYITGATTSFLGSESSDVTILQSTYSPPDNASHIIAKVKPTYTKSSGSGTYNKNIEDRTTTKYDLKNNANAPQEVAPTPSLSVDGVKLTASCDNITDSKTNRIRLVIVDYSSKKNVYDKTLTVTKGVVKVIYTGTPGHEYRARAIAANYKSKKWYWDDEWSDYSSSVIAVPAAPGWAKDAVTKTSITSFKLVWNACSTATSYKLEYTTDRSYFNTNESGVSSVTISSGTTANLTGLDSGSTYYFRVQAVNSTGSSAWSSIVSGTIGKKPGPPTTWSNTTTVIVGEKLKLYWVHNSQDNSSETYAKLEIKIDGVDASPKEPIKNAQINDEDHKDDTNVYEIDTSSYSEGATILWRVCTRGIIDEYGDWSVQRQVDVYAKPEVTLTLDALHEENISVLPGYPFCLLTSTSPSTQTPISFNVSIIALDSYETTNSLGENEIITSGDELYSRYFDTSENLNQIFTPSDVNLDPEHDYIFKVIVAMDSGLTAENELEFHTSWEESTIEVTYNAFVIDDENYTISLVPTAIEVAEDDDEEYDDNPDDDYEYITPLSGYWMSVYRIDFDGTFTEIASNIVSNSNTYVTDPHPRLDSPTYRIIATSEETGAITYEDFTPDDEDITWTKGAILQWNESFEFVELGEGDTTVDSVVTAGSATTLKLLYNIDISDSSAPQNELVEYIGRSFPVSYYGTQVGSTATWNMDVPKEDTDTLYLLRRLARWLGDVYVREPSGSGYWANVQVSFSQKYSDLVIPVTLNITRVEGGK